MNLKNVDLLVVNVQIIYTNAICLELILQPMSHSDLGVLNARQDISPRSGTGGAEKWIKVLMEKEKREKRAVPSPLRQCVY